MAAPAPAPAFTGCPPDWGAFEKCAGSRMVYQAVPFVPFLMPDCYQPGPDGKSQLFGGAASPMDALQAMQIQLEGQNILWAETMEKISEKNVANLANIFTQITDGTKGMQIAIDAAFAPARHLVAYLTVSIFFLGVLVAAVAWAV
jgi:hypothetical protein